MDTNKSVMDWFDLADSDIKGARDELDSGGDLYASSLCHNAIEYAFKAIITHVTNGEEPPKTESLIVLDKKAQLDDKISKEHLVLIKELNYLYAEASYLGYMGVIIQRHSKKYLYKLIERTTELLCWIKEQLPNISNDSQVK